MKHLKLKDLEKSYELGVVTKEEYEKKKKEIEEMPEEEVKEVKEEVNIEIGKMKLAYIIFCLNRN